MIYGSMNELGSPSTLIALDPRCEAKKQRMVPSSTHVIIDTCHHRHRPSSTQAIIHTGTFGSAPLHTSGHGCPRHRRHLIEDA